MLSRIRRWSAARLPAFAAWALLIAITPTLSYIDHWPREVHIPGTESYLRLGPPSDDHAGGAHDDSNDEAAHERHCHGAPAGCTDIPFTGASGFVALNEWLALAGASGLLLALAGRRWLPGLLFTPRPEAPPPRAVPA